MKTSRRSISFAAVMVAVLGAAGCSGDADARGSTTITGAGATFAMPLISVWSSEFQRETGARVNYNSIGSGGGIRAHIDRTVHFAASEAPLTEEQADRAEGTLTIPFTIGTVTLAYNLPGVDDLRLTGELVAAIYLNEIRRWNDPRIAEVNPGVDLPDRSIVVAHRSDGSGTTYVFTDYLSKVSDRWREEVGYATSVSWPAGIGGNGNEGVAGAIQNNPGAIGYIELAYARSLGLPTAALRNRDGNFVQPSLEGATAAARGAVDALPGGARALARGQLHRCTGRGRLPDLLVLVLLRLRGPLPPRRPGDARGGPPDRGVDRVGRHRGAGAQRPGEQRPDPGWRARAEPRGAPADELRGRAAPHGWLS
jgi:phosphate transport system substrate-binding protein